MGRRKGSKTKNIGDMIGLTAEQLEARQRRLEASRNYVKEVRAKAIRALGGVCQVCGEVGGELSVKAITTLSKEWSQHVLYRRVVEDAQAGKPPQAMLLCWKCFQAARVKEGKSGRPKGPSSPRSRLYKGVGSAYLPPAPTGEVFYIGGERVEEVANGWILVKGDHGDFLIKRWPKVDLGVPEAEGE